MPTHDWNMFASLVATFVRRRMITVQRGAMLIRCQSDGSVIAAVFGNDNYWLEPKVRREVQLLRQRLGKATAEVLAFGVSDDRHSWALLVRGNSERYQTQPGRTFQMEMLKAYLEDNVQGAWLEACGFGPERVEPAAVQNGPPAP